MDDNKPQGWQDQKPSGFPPPVPPPQSEKTEPPVKPPTPPTPSRPTPLPPPPPEITLRTMKSDLDSLKQTGGTVSTPKPFTPPELKSESPKPAAPPLPPPPPLPPTAGKPPLSVSEIKKLETAAKPAKPVIEEEKGKSKKLVRWSIIIIIAIAVGFLAYFFVYPVIFPTDQAPPPPAVTTPSPITEPPITETQPPSPIKQHISLLSFPDETISKTLFDINLLSITQALQEAALTQRPAEILAEVTLSDTNGQIDASAFLPALLPEISTSAIQDIFEEDFTVALYHNADGVWPIYLFKLKFDTDISETQNFTISLESSANLSNLFLASPGTPNAAGFRSGQVNGLITRYLTYSQKGAALNSAWSNDTFIISASYNGLKKVITSL